ncbi:MAG TPA: Calx-beta domain-containing protein [Pyrinomonadaceae bacterium]|nr:Calx-beta domain-containing protein [Pyrinomonadaceae bacterium]
MPTRLRRWPAAAAALIFLLSAGARDASAQLFPNPITLPPCKDNTIALYNVCEVVIPQTAYAANQEVAAYTGPDIRAVFRNQRTNTQRTVPAFYDKDESGRIVFRVRFNPDEAPPAGSLDTWSYTLGCTMQGGGDCPSQINLTGGALNVSGSAEGGFLRRDAAQTHRFVYDNGYHPFIWGQTYYDIVPNVRAVGGWEDAVQKSTQDYHLNKVRMLLYPFGGYFYADSQPFLSADNHDAIDLGHWRAFDRVVNKLYGLRDPKGSRILAEVILFTDTNPRSLAGPVPDDRYVRYAVARYGAFPNVMWCMTNEWQLTKPPGATNNALRKAYFNDRATTLVQTDPWTLPPDANPQRRRATSIHPNNDTPVFQFYDQTWPSHAVLQYSIGHGPCDGQPCAQSDEWANFSIATNFRPANNMGKNWPVANDEYGYINSWKESIGKCLISQHDQRRGMWAIAVAGGYGTFGDNTGSCPDADGNKSIQPILRSDWRADPAYTDIKNLFKYFNTLLPSDWWLMKGNNNRVARVPGPKAMRVYAMEQPGTAATAGRGSHVVYSVPVNNTGSVASGQFKVKSLPKGNYLTAFYNPRNGAPRNATRKEIKKVTTTQFATPSYDDWVFRIYPDPQAPRPKSSFDEYEIVWVGDSLPTGAVPAGYNENWTWTESDPTPVSGTYAHQSPLVADVHQHYFTGATETLKVNAGDTLYAYVYLDPANPPSEVMLQWFDGNWEHRAYWGANLLPWGVNGTTSRRYMGALPAAGQWVRLEVPASLVGLEGRTLDGMAFALHGGMATWDDAGKTGSGVQATNIAVGKTTTQSSTAGAGPAQLAADGNTNGNYYASSVTHTNLDPQAWWQVDLGGKGSIDQIKIWPRTDCCTDRLANFHVFVSDEPFESSDLSATQEQPGVSTYFVAGQAASPTVVNTDGESGRYVRVQLTGSNYLSLAEVEVVGKSGLSAPPPAAPNMSVGDASVAEGNVGTSGAVFTVSLSAASANTVTVNYSTANGTAVAGSDYTAASGSLVFSPGQTTKTVSVPVTGDVVVEGNETFFVNLSGASGAVVADGQGQGVIVNDDSAPPPSQPGEVVWVEDGVPPGTTLGGEEPWNWTGAGSYPTPFSGASAHLSPYAPAMHQHWFVGATGAHALTPGAGDKLFAYVFLDPMNPPSEVMLQWADSTSWEHRAYWGANLLPWGTNGTASRRYMGPLPPAGQWVRLEVPASTVGLENVTLQGMAFSLYGGMATWDYAGKVSAETAWFDDGLPAGATPGADNDGWNWVGGTDPAPFSGALAHRSNVAAGLHQHYFTGATGTLAVGYGSVLYAYVYLDPANPPSQVMLQWNDGTWEHRAYWGANLLPWGVDGTAGRRYMGPLPPTGRWVRLEVPANVVGLEGRNVNGMAFSLYGGRATWDRAGRRP